MMTIELTPDLESRLREEAARRGLEAEALALESIEKGVSPPDKEYGYLQRTLTPEEWSRSAREWAESNHDWPVLSDGAVTRESIYADHD
jgi:hypothetical protein